MKPETMPTSSPFSSGGSGTAIDAKRILIVDDEPNILRSLEFLMTRSGFAVELARNGREVRAVLGQLP